MILPLNLILIALVSQTPDQAELHNLAGSWSLGFNGKLSFYKFEVRADGGYSWQDRSGVERGTLKLDTSQSPRTIDFTVQDRRSNTPREKHGIYKLDTVTMNINGRSTDVQRLTTCIAANGPRPTDFDRDQGAITEWYKK
jgi:uncharacterized protein (TIGR03067 family)